MPYNYLCGRREEGRAYDGFITRYALKEGHRSRTDWRAPVIREERISDLDKAGTARAPGDPTRWCRHAIEDSRHCRHTHRVWKEAEHRLMLSESPT